MTNDHLSDSHQWVHRKVEIDGKTLFHRQCTACGRDFVMGAETGGWRAVHVGLFEFDFLDEETDERWVSAECPCPGWRSGQRAL
jgi:hypothetical protein